MIPRLIILLALSVGLVLSQPHTRNWTAEPFNPPAFPLAVRSPYLNTWLSQGLGPTQFNIHTWPNFWNIDNTVTSIYASIVVDGHAYRLIGTAQIPNVSAAQQISTKFTATQTSVTFTTGPMQIVVSFLSPIEPTDLVRQSLPFSYLTISASSADGNEHSVQMYSDISGEFITGDRSKTAQWTADDSDDQVVLSMQLQNPMPFSEIHAFAQDATEYYSFGKIDGTKTSWAIAQDTVNRANAANSSIPLGNSADPLFRAVGDLGQNQPVLGIAIDWGEVRGTPEPAVWALGVVRSPSIQYKTASGLVEKRYPYFLSAYNDAPSAARTFLDDFSRASAAAFVFDTRLQDVGNNISSPYADLLVLSARQVMGSMDITLSKTSNGEWNMSDVKIFMKNMGGAGSDSVGTSTSINAVDTLYAAFPAFIYLNPAIGRYLLAPLLEYQDSLGYTLNYAAKNIGSAYPNATADGIEDGHYYGVEETGNMLIMILAYSQASGDTSLLSNHYSMLRGWAEYLRNNSLTPINQRSPDFSPFSGLSNNNQTNTALKGIIGIAAMARISEYMGITDDQKSFNDTATAFFSEWQSEALSPDQSHISFFYGSPDSSGLIYNVFADKLLQLGLVTDAVYNALTKFYQTVPAQNIYGIPLSDTQPHNTSMNWMMLAASAVTDQGVQNSLISKAHTFVASATNFHPMITNYDPVSGSLSGTNGANSPALGAIFALLPLNTTAMANITTNGTHVPPQAGSALKAKKLAVGAIVGGIIGGLVICGVGILFWHRTLQRRSMRDLRVHPVIKQDEAGNGTPQLHVSNQTMQPSKPRISNTYVPIIIDPAVSKPPAYVQSGPSVSGARDNREVTPVDIQSMALVENSYPAQVIVQPSDTLRMEVENLRREIELMRESDINQMHLLPSYSDPGL